MASTDDPVKSDGPRGGRKERGSLRPGGPLALIGTVISGRYRIEKLLGEGGMGAVYQAEHTHMRKRLAIKVLHPEMSRLTEVVQRFEREAMAAAHIDHPNVAAATDFGKLDDGSFFLVLEYVEGNSLRDAIAKGGRLELGRALHIMRQVASALGRAHSLGIVHRDLKPENVMLIERDADPDFVKVLDFGIAKVPVGSITGEADKGTPAGQALTQLGMVYGTPEYMAPEQALGQPVDARADLYALGIVAYEMLTGVRPFDHESKVTLLGMHVTAPVPRMEDKMPGCNVPPEVEAIVRKCLAKEASERYADAKELIEALTITMTALAAQGVIGMPLAPGSMRASQVSMSRGDYTGPTIGVTHGVGFAAAPLGPTGEIHRVAGPPSVAEPPAMTAPRLGSRPFSPRLMAILGGGVGAIALAVTVAIVVARAIAEAPSEANDELPATPSASASNEAKGPKLEPELAAARADLEAGKFKDVIDRLAPYENEPNVELHQLLQKAYTGARRPREAMIEAATWLKLDPSAATDLKLAEDIRNAALGSEGADEAFELLEKKLGTIGIDILYDLGYLTSGQGYPRAAARARKSLERPEVRALASPALAVVLDFREAKGCDGKHAVLARAKEDGDYRLLPLLRPYQATRGCGFLSRSDCYPCMRRDSALRDAIAAIQARSKQ